MKALNYIITILFFATLQAQNKTESGRFFSDMFKNRKDKIIYTEQYFHELEDIETSIRSHMTLHKIEIENANQPKTPSDSINLTKHELDYVITELKKHNGHKISQNLIPNSKHICRRKVDKIFKDGSKQWPYFNKKFGKNLNSFSRPIFLRNNSICFFYSSNSCGSLCGSGGLSVYVKENGIWYFYDSVYMWIS